MAKIKRIVVDILALAFVAGAAWAGYHLYRDHKNLHTLVIIEYQRQQPKVGP